MIAKTDSLNSVRARLVARREELRARLGRLNADQRRDAEALSADALTAMRSRDALTAMR